MADQRKPRKRGEFQHIGSVAGPIFARLLLKRGRRNLAAERVRKRLRVVKRGK